MKNIWKWIVLILSTLGAVLLFLLSGRKPPNLSTASQLLKGDDQLTDKIKDIQAKTDEEILADATPQQKDTMDKAVESSVDAAMAAAAKFRRKKTSG